MNIFEAVKQTVTTRQTAESYGTCVNRAGKANCPFHNDRTPSMKVDWRFHCFGCGADGDVIDFTAQLYGLDAKSAAKRLAEDFQIPLHKTSWVQKYVRMAPKSCGCFCWEHSPGMHEVLLDKFCEEGIIHNGFVGVVHKSSPSGSPKATSEPGWPPAGM